MKELIEWLEAEIRDTSDSVNFCEKHHHQDLDRLRGQRCAFWAVEDQIKTILWEREKANELSE